MRVLVLGSGAREHALAARLSGEPGVSYVLCAPGNAGIARSLPTEPVDVLDTAGVIRLVHAERIDLTVVGPEAPLANGLVDSFRAAGLQVFGPTRAAAQLETSKAFAKDFMQRHGVPTARYRVCSSPAEALASIRAGEFGDALVVKADGLAAGKGVIVATDRSIAEKAVTAAMVDKTFGAAGARIVLEELLTGPEVSFFAVANGESYVPLLSAQDHKRIFDDDRGPNTGGMGAFSPSPLLTAALQSRIEREIVQPVLRGMAAEGHPFTGFLYCGLMLTADGPKVIEFNVRFGDPEAQVVLPLLRQPLIELLAGIGHRDAGSHGVAVGVVLAAYGYPENIRTGDVIHGLDEVARDCADVQLRFAGVKQQGDALVTSGGRVLTVVAAAPSFPIAIARAYEAVSKIKFDGMHYRGDIGRRAIRS